MSLILINAISTLLYDDFIVIVINHLAQIYMKSVNGRKLCACNMPNSQSLLNCSIMEFLSPFGGIGTKKLMK